MNQKAPLSILHTDFESGWRGGQQQVAYLIEGLLRRGAHTGLVCRTESALADWAKKAGLRCYPMPMGFEWNPWTAWRIASLCRTEGYSILHAHSSHALGVATLSRLLNPSLRLVATRRVDFKLGKSRLRLWKYRSHLLDRLVCISKGVREVLLKAGIPAERMAVIRSGVDLERFSGSPTGQPPPPGLETVTPDQIVVGTVAALCWHKDYPNLLRAARIVLDRSDKIIFCAVGNGPDEPEVRALAAELNLGSRFIFAGFQKDVGAYLRAFDLFVMSSKSEGLGTSLLDAQAMGLPIVATAVGGIPEALDAGQAGSSSPR